VLAAQAPGLTFGEVRAAAHKVVLRLDPDAVRKRKDAARSEAQVRRFREASGNAGECGLAPLCRHHHRCKQAEGWRLEQPEPGVLVWRVPSGRSFTTRPTEYSI
jgi:hypothetical protein